MNDGTTRIVREDPTILPPGFGPRHMTITTRYFETQQQQRVYVINELQPFISIFRLDEDSGRLIEQGMVETVSSDTQGHAGAEIALHPSESWLYCSNRESLIANGAILVYTILEDGNLEKIQV